MYGGLSTLTFFLVLFLQQIAGYSALQSGLALVPVTIVSFVVSPRAGRLAMRFGPRLFMGSGPLLGGFGLLALCTPQTGLLVLARASASARRVLARALDNRRAADGDRPLRSGRTRCGRRQWRQQRRSPE